MNMSKLLKQKVFPGVSFYSRRTVLSDAAGHSLPHYHDFYEVFIVEEGPGQHHINGGDQGRLHQMAGRIAMFHDRLL